MSNLYLVKWDINLQADTPEEAARKALAIQHNPNSVATVFSVIACDGNGEVAQPDLMEFDEQEGSQ